MLSFTSQTTLKFSPESQIEEKKTVTVIKLNSLQNPFIIGYI